MWEAIHTEGSLAIDLYDTPNELIAITAIAGISPEHIEVAVHGDMLTIRGERIHPCTEDKQSLIQECHWGAFSRSVLLPVDVFTDGVEATMTNGVLTIRMPKMKRDKKILIKETL